MPFSRININIFLCFWYIIWHSVEYASILGDIERDLRLVGRKCCIVGVPTDFKHHKRTDVLEKAVLGLVIDLDINS